MEECYVKCFTIFGARTNRVVFYNLGESSNGKSFECHDSRHVGSISAGLWLRNDKDYNAEEVFDNRSGVGSCHYRGLQYRQWKGEYG